MSSAVAERNSSTWGALLQTLDLCVPLLLILLLLLDPRHLSAQHCCACCLLYIVAKLALTQACIILFESPIHSLSLSLSLSLSH
jgi:hypothetical protein